MDMTPTYFWMGIFLVAGVLFWGVAFWAIVRGGKDVLDIIHSETAKEKSARMAARPSAGTAE
jgi:hypothetical protein